MFLLVHLLSAVILTALMGNPSALPTPACPGLVGLASYVGTDCLTTKCETPREYPGPYCVCKICPPEPIESANQFDKELYQCLVNGMGYCQASKLLNATSPPAPQTPTRSFPAINSGSSKFTASPYIFSEDTTKRPTLSEDSDKWIGLAIGLGVPAVGFAALIIWFWWDQSRRPKTEQDAADRRKLNEDEQDGQDGQDEPARQLQVTNIPQLTD